MALAAILSAFRQLVLDGIELPPTQDERAALYSKKFQGLSPEEIEDLSKMDPARLKVYTSSVFMAEGGILSTAFPLTLAILRRSWPGSAGLLAPALRSTAAAVRTAACRAACRTPRSSAR